MSNKANRHRAMNQGFSLLEVVACVGLMSLLSIPIVGLLRSSVQIWDDQTLRGSSDASLIDASRWIAGRVRNAASIYRVRANRLELTNQLGKVEALYLRGGELILDDGSGISVIAGPLADLSFVDQRIMSPSKSVAVQISITPISVSPAFRPVAVTFLAVPEWVTQ